MFASKIRSGAPMTVYGDGRQTRAWLWVMDISAAIDQLKANPDAYNQVYNIGADTPYSVNFLAHVVADAMGVEPNIVHLPAREEVQHAFGSNDKLRAVLGEWNPVDLEEGIMQAVMQW